MDLVINSFGVTLQKENDLFVVSSNEGKQTFPPDVLKSISIGKSTRLTSDVILLAIKYQIDIFFTNDFGNPEGRIWSVKYGSTSSIRKAQLDFMYSTKVIDWVKELIIKKIDNQAALLLGFQPHIDEDFRGHNVLKSAINSLDDYKTKINKIEAEFISDVASSLRGWEGAAGRKYFQTLSFLLPEEMKFNNRTRQPATDPFNALLNYAYGMLYRIVEGALVKAGLDPYVGIFHRDEYNRPALVFDVIEKYRVWMDFVVFQLCKYQAIPKEAFETVENTGAITLMPLAKRILVQSVNDFLSEIINLGKPLSRTSHIENDATQLATYFLNSQKDVTR